MPRFLPAQLTDETKLSSRQVAAARRAEASQALEVHRYGLGARARAEIDMIDSQAVADAARAALKEEIDLLEYGMARAGGSAAKIELVARTVERLAAIDDRRITRRFGS
jgi:hypothetical protein